MERDQPSSHSPLQISKIPSTHGGATGLQSSFTTGPLGLGHGRRAAEGGWKGNRRGSRGRWTRVASAAVQSGASEALIALAPAEEQLGVAAASRCHDLAHPRRFAEERRERVEVVEPLVGRAEGVHQQASTSEKRPLRDRGSGGLAPSDMGSRKKLQSRCKEPVRGPGRRIKFSRFLLRKSGEPGRNRTFNQQIKSLLLCQLSYGPTAAALRRN